MKRILVLVSLAAGLVWTAGVAFGQTGTAPEQTPVKPATPVTPEMQPAQQATTADASVKADAGVAVIVEKAKKAPPQEVEETEKKIRESVKLVEKEAATKGESMVASRLAAEFGVAAEALVTEKGTFQSGWGELMIAHTMLANANGAVTLDQLFEMRRDGLGWGQIGHGLDLKLGEVASAVKAESRVATGLAKADGKPAKIQSATVKANAGTKVGVTSGHKGAGVASDVGVGATVKGAAGK